jgi:hypothetical protein
MGEWRERKQSLSPLKGKSLLKIFSNFSREERKYMRFTFKTIILKIRDGCMKETPRRRITVTSSLNEIFTRREIRVGESIHGPEFLNF